MVGLPEKEVVRLENFLVAMQCFEKSDKMSIAATLEIADASRLMELICEENGSAIERGFARIADRGEGCVGLFFATLVSAIGKMPKITDLKCHACGNINAEGSIFCCKCGSKL